MAKCPACEHVVATPFVLNVDAWRWLTCPHCSARLERKNPRYLTALSGFLIALIALGGLGHRSAIVAEVLMVVLFFAIFFIEFWQPKLQLRKPLPKPEIKLNIDGASE